MYIYISNEKKELITKDSSIFFIPNYFYDAINFVLIILISVVYNWLTISNPPE